ncbi:ParB/RepB/Spo0J family partition protein [Pseudonocardia sp. ICBG601]|uniref:ParB/RepB/Spo0J family partition protein n=1 Tax=Pseudonocardia sp. ICBG601 TaxID=2846759 RepID=UPI001CF6D8F3|nr:ParB/RepB/Spo0J family partition protein [Pseudonocardia sp. ICBG601]
MGKRINLAELAKEEVGDSYTAAAPEAAVREQAAPQAKETAETPPAAQDAPSGPTSLLLPVEDIVFNPLNQRSANDDEGSEFYELVSTIGAHGILQPIVVCSTAAFASRYPDQHASAEKARWVALIGNRRLRAAMVAGLQNIPAVVNDERVASMYEVMLVENSHRKALGPLHEAEAMRRLVEETGTTQRALASRIGRTPMYVSQRMALLGLVPALREALEDGSLKVEQARQFGTLSQQEQEAIVAAGPPYRRQPVGGLTNPGPAPRRTRRSIAVSSPARAAASIREVFTETERAELVRLLLEQPPPEGRSMVMDAGDEEATS